MIVHSTDGRVIGSIDNGVFFKKVRGSIHRLNRPPAWAIDSEAYDSKIRHSCRSIVVDDTESGTRYLVSVALFDDKKGYLNRGHGGQYYLVMKYWQVMSKEQSRLL